MELDILTQRFHDPNVALALAKAIRTRATRPIRLMEFCGGHTHAILRFGIPHLLPDAIELLSGPGCPVCVTSATDIDHAIELANIPDVILASFGDMIRVPGSRSSLAQAKSNGADVRVVYSPLDALEIARRAPDRPVIFLGIGFETTTPTIAATVLAAAAQGQDNFYIFSAHKLTPPATKTILAAGDLKLDGIIGPGHVSTIIGADAWQFLPDDYGIPCTITGFEPTDILRAVLSLVEMIEAGRPDVVNKYTRGVQHAGNRTAQAAMDQVFEVADAEWRGLGPVPESGLHLREQYARHDAAVHFPVVLPPSREPPGCRCGDVLRGVVRPHECALFGKSCTPDNPIGPCMVSDEGACAAYYRYTIRDL
jgi:hydrogenase expression/formation protein HypD